MDEPPTHDEIEAISMIIAKRNRVSSSTLGNILSSYKINHVGFWKKYLNISTDEWGYVIFSVKPEWFKYARKVSYAERFNKWINNLRR